MARTADREMPNNMAIAADIKRDSAIYVRSSGRGPHVVLLHGGMGSWTHWQRNIDTLARYFQVHAVDLPGFGEAPDVPDGISPEDYLALVHRSIERLIWPEGTGALVGFSFGGAVAADLARRLGPKTERLVLIGPGGFGEAPGRVFNLRQAPPTGTNDASYRAVVRHNLLAIMLADPTSVDETTIDLQCENIARTRFVSMKISRRTSLVGDLAATTYPLLMIWGEHDAFAYPSIAARVEQCRRVRPDLYVDIVPSGGHWVQYERPAVVNSLLVEFLSGRLRHLRRD